MDTADRVLREVHDLLRDRFGIYFSTIQTEADCLDERQAQEIDLVREAAGGRSNPAA
jgi:cobalt-zinc-cadmium efflux system protein